MSPRPSRRTAGFSLLEVMVGATLMAVVAILLSQAFMTLTRLEALSARHHEATRALSSFLSAPTTELRQLEGCENIEARAEASVASSARTVCLVQRRKCGVSQGVWRCGVEGAWWLFDLAAGTSGNRIHLTILRRADALE